MVEVTLLPFWPYGALLQAFLWGVLGCSLVALRWMRRRERQERNAKQTPGSLAHQAAALIMKSEGFAADIWRKALREYGRHLESCDKYVDGKSTFDCTCSCGLDAMLESGR
ncbi:MAG TPA: hypothetical protein VF678_12050 [bacterium]